MDFTQQIIELNKRIADLERNQIQVQLDPTISLYLQVPIDAAIALLPTQTYSTSVPSGIAPIGSIWLYNSGTLSTNAIYAYTSIGWTQIK